MPNPTRQEIIDAHEALERLERTAQSGVNNLTGEKTITIRKNLILAVLPPKPAPTMAEVEWDDDKHYLAEAEHSEYGKVVMVDLDENCLVGFFLPRICENRCYKVPREELTPTGKRYTLTEVQE